MADLAGRGFASQEILEELAARDELSNKVGGFCCQGGVQFAARVEFREQGQWLQSQR